MPLDRKRPQDWPEDVLKKVSARSMGSMEATFKPRQVDALIPTVPNQAGNGVSQAALWADNPKDASTYFLAVRFDATMNLYNVLKDAPTDALHRMRDLCDLMLAQRSDGRR